MFCQAACLQTKVNKPRGIWRIFYYILNERINFFSNLFGTNIAHARQEDFLLGNNICVAIRTAVSVFGGNWSAIKHDKESASLGCSQMSQSTAKTALTTSILLLSKDKDKLSLISSI